VTAARVLPAWLRGYERSWLRPDLDVQAADMLDDLARELGRTGVELRLATVRAPARTVLHRSGLAARVRMAETIDDAIAD
jgi:MFS superfamily sulfate permease-like transporter